MDVGEVLNAPGRHPLVVEIERLRAELRAANGLVVDLEIELNGNREIGAAIGMVMAVHQVDYDHGLGMLREASGHTHRPLRDVAADVLSFGVPTEPAEPDGAGRLQAGGAGS